MAGEAEVVLTGGKIEQGSFVAQSSTVTVWATKIDDNFDKPLVIIPLVRQQGVMATQNPDTMIIDLGRVNQIISVQGNLIDETTESAQTKKTNLKTIFDHYRTVQITWGTGSRAQTFLGNLSKCGVTETAGIIGAQQSGYESEKNFAVQLALIVGTDK